MSDDSTGPERGELGGPGTSSLDREVPEGDSPEDDFESMLASLPEDGMQVQIMAYDKRGKRSWVDTWGAEGFELESVREAFGGGKYMLRLLNKGGRYMKGKTVRIAGRPKDLSQLDHGRADDGREGEERRGGEGDRIGRVERELVGLADRLERMVEELRRPPQAPPQQQNPAELFGSMMQAVEAATEPLREALRDRRDNERDDQRSATAALMKGIELGTTLAGGKGGVEGVVERLGMPLLDMLNSQRGGGSPALPATPNPPAGMIDTNKLPSDPPPRWPGFLGPYLPTLLTMAERGLDPELRAAVVLDEIPGGMYPAIHEELAREGFADEFFGAVDAAAPHRPWLERFFGSAREQLAGDDTGL